MKILSLFDYSGQWPAPYAAAGYEVESVDIKAGRDVLLLPDRIERLRGVLAAPPCTDFSVSGAQYWPAKDLDGRTQKSVALVRKAIQIVHESRPDFYAFENPVGRFRALFPELGNPYWFDPCDFAGWLQFSDSDHNEFDRLRRKDGKGFTMAEVQSVIAANLYTKKTGLFGIFNRDLERRRIEPIRCNAQGSPLQSFGGAGEATKTARSHTPRGFAKAFFEANK